MKMAKTPEGDWSSLLPEILNLIAKSLSEISDFVRFRAVCTAWRSSTPISDQPPQFPWILERIEGLDRYREGPYLRCYSIPCNKIHSIRAPNVLNKLPLRRAFDGHLVIWHRTRQLSVINPLNNEYIPLPAFPFDCRPFWVGHQQNQKGDNSVCYGYWGMDSKLKFYFFHFRRDMENWCELEVEHDHGNQCRCFYLKGMFFVVELGTGVTKVIDITAGSLSYTIPPIVGSDLQLGNINLVEVSGDIFRVHQLYDNDYKTFFDIHRIDAIECGSPRWVNTKNIGNHALFIHNIDGCFALRANRSCGIEANCIYYFDEVFSGFSEGFSSVLKKADIKTGAQERLPCPFQEVLCWFAPNLRHL